MDSVSAEKRVRQICDSFILHLIGRHCGEGFRDQSQAVARTS